VTKSSFKLTTPQARQNAIKAVEGAPDGYRVTLQPDNRTLAQNAAFWAILSDLREQLYWLAAYSPDEVKCMLMDLLADELKQLPKLDGSGTFFVGHSSSRLNKQQFAELLEVTFKYGAENDVRWSMDSRQAFDEYGVGND
jgi:hypothetical protein